MGLTYYAARLMGETLGENIEIEAGALLYGGINDIDNNWAPSHWTHRTGTDIDFDVVGANNRRKCDQMIRAGERGGFRRCIVEAGATHVHCLARLFD